MSFSAHFVKGLLKKIFPKVLRKTQLINLSYGVYGQIQSQSGQMSEIVRKVKGATKHKHRLKRFWRFLSNQRVKPEKLFSFWICWCIKTFNKDRVINVAIDWTTLPGNIQCLMIAIPFKGRAIPLIFRLCLHEQIKDSQNSIEERLVARLINLVKEAFPNKKLLLTADRGFGRATFIEFLLQKKVLFVIRVKADVEIKTAKGKVWVLRKLGKTLKEYIPLWFENILYRSDGKVTGVNLACVFVPKVDKDPDPWFLVTNLKKARTTIDRYRERFQIEEWFRDLKHELGIADLQTKNLKRVRRIMLLSCISNALLMLVGNAAIRFERIKDKLITGGSKAASRIWFALKIIQEKLMDRHFWLKVYYKGVAP